MESLEKIHTWLQECISERERLRENMELETRNTCDPALES